MFGFIGYALVFPERLSLTNTEDNRKGLNHFWRVIGYLLGISNKCVYIFLVNWKRKITFKAI